MTGLVTPRQPEQLRSVLSVSLTLKQSAHHSSLDLLARVLLPDDVGEELPHPTVLVSDPDELLHVLAHLLRAAREMGGQRDRLGPDRLRSLLLLRINVSW